MKLLEIASNQKGNLGLPVASFSRFEGPLEAHRTLRLMQGYPDPAVMVRTLACEYKCLLSSVKAKFYSEDVFNLSK